MVPRSWLELLLLSHAQRRPFVQAMLERARPPGLVATLDAVRPAAQRARWADSLLRRCERSAIDLITLDDPRLPPTLRHLHDPPPVLFVRGDLALLTAPRRLAIVGSRRATAPGKRMAEALARQLALDVVVVSGLAYGIDAAAHQGTCVENGSPVGVVGTGLDRVYPKGNAQLHGRVGELGCLVSEYPPGVTARPYHFVARNRIVAALSHGVVVVEATMRSGALSTVDFALQMSREVMAVAGCVEEANAQGCLQLLRDGATLVRHADDVREAMGWEVPVEATDLPERPMTPEEVARQWQTSLVVALAGLGQLELVGIVERVDGGRYRGVPRRAPGG